MSLDRSELLEKLLHSMQGFGKPHRNNPGGNAENCIEENLPVTEHHVRWEFQSRTMDQPGPAYGCSNHGRDNDRAEAVQIELAQHHLQRKAHPSDGSVEYGGKAGRSPTAHQHPHPLPGYLKELAYCGTNGGADLNDGSFFSGGAARTQGNGRGQHARGKGTHLDDAAFQGHSLHGGRDTVALGLNWKKVDERSQKEGSKGG